jgi:hypothetical protein
VVINENLRGECPMSAQRQTTIIHADISQYAAIKMAFEQIFGNKAWRDLKECTSIKTWKKYISKLLQAIRLAVKETIEIRDDVWFAEICEHIERGLQITQSARSIEELHSGLSATLIRIVFLQIGMIPNRRQAKHVTLTRENWHLNDFRTVQYIQSNSQLERQFWNKQQKTLGVEKQMNIWERYRASKSKIPYSKWCTELAEHR